MWLVSKLRHVALSYVDVSHNMSASVQVETKLPMLAE